MKEECLICEAPLVYLKTDEVMECAVCHKRRIVKPNVRRGIMSVTSAI